MSNTSKLKAIPFEHIILDKAFNSRQDYEDIDELAESIQDSGLLQPIGVTPKSSEDADSQKYYVVYGFRRYLAICKIREKHGANAFSEVDAVIQTGTVQDLKEKNLKENLDRKSLKPYETALAIKKMANSGLEQRDIAKRLGRPQSWVSYHYKVATKLGVEATKAFESGDITLEQALLVADVDEAEQPNTVEAIKNAETRKEARKIAKSASKAAGTRRNYANKGRPSAKNLAQYVQDVSFDGTSPGFSDEKKQFLNGIAAGLRIAIGDLEMDKASNSEDYFDTNFAKSQVSPAEVARLEKKEAKRQAKEAKLAAKLEAQQAREAKKTQKAQKVTKKKPGRKKKDPSEVLEATA